MSKSNTFENNILDHIFQNVAIALIGDATGLPGAATVGNLYISLHTADPGEAGDQTTNEATYTGYARKAVPRNNTNWSTASGGAVNNLLAITFAQCTAGSNTITHFGIGTSSSGAGKLLYKAPLSTVIQGPFTGKVTGNAITVPGHSLAVNERVAFYPAFGSSLPGGLTEGTVYWVITVSGDDITVSTTSGGGAVTISSSGDGVAFECNPINISAGITPEFGVGALVVNED